VGAGEGRCGRQAPACVVHCDNPQAGLYSVGLTCKGARAHRAAKGVGQVICSNTYTPNSTRQQCRYDTSQRNAWLDGKRLVDGAGGGASEPPTSQQGLTKGSLTICHKHSRHSRHRKHPCQLCTRQGGRR
jgi:hypothetical protein